MYPYLKDNVKYIFMEYNQNFHVQVKVIISGHTNIKNNEKILS